MTSRKGPIRSVEFGQSATGMTRREWHRLAMAGIIAAARPLTSAKQPARPDSRVRGVQIGAQSYSFRDRPLDAAIDGLLAAGISSCELWQGHVEPKEPPGLAERDAREQLRQWRLTVPLEELRAVRAKFDRAGIDLYAYNLSFRDDFSDAEIERGFEMGRALGVKVMTASANRTTVPRIAPVATRYQMRVGMHNHSNLSGNEFATPESLEQAIAISPFIAINLDIGHFTAANFDAVDFLQRHHDRIVTLHVKDRKRNQGPAVPFGQGDTPIRQVLALLKRNQWSIPANIEYEYEGGDTVAEVKKCVAYCKDALD